MDINNNILLPNSNIKKHISSVVLQNRVPIQSTLKITHVCNFKCLHCYINPLKKPELNLSSMYWFDILQQLKENGCISLTLTGGEPLCHPEFSLIYEKAYNLNFKIIIMTNLSLINEELIRLFSVKPPFSIVGTLYGVSNDVYETFCLSKNAWDRVRNNIIALRGINSKLKLRTVLNSVNFHELAEMKDFCNMLDIPFHAYRKIGCDVNGSIDPKKYQISDLQIKESYEILDDFDVANTAQEKLWENGYKFCCAGLSSCYINPQGEMYLCNHSPQHSYSINRFGFDFCWNEMYKLRKSIIEVENECSHCQWKMHCGRCNPIFTKEKEFTGFPFKDCKKYGGIIQ